MSGSCAQGAKKATILANAEKGLSSYISMAESRVRMPSATVLGLVSEKQGHEWSKASQQQETVLEN